MSKSPRPSESTKRALIGKAGNHCAFPECQTPLVEPGYYKVIGKICHIEARRPGGPRYNSNQNPLERNSGNNLIMLCGRHHDIIDYDVETYSVERLHEMKATHENKQKGVSNTTTQDIFIDTLRRRRYIVLERLIKKLMVYKNDPMSYRFTFFRDMLNKHIKEDSSNDFYSLETILSGDNIKKMTEDVIQSGVSTFASNSSDEAILFMDFILKPI